LPSRLQVEPSVATKEMTPRRQRHSEPSRKSSSNPLRGYVWSPTANALVRIDPADLGGQDSAKVAPRGRQ
jgi:hypothetical protein